MVHLFCSYCVSSAKLQRNWVWQIQGFLAYNWYVLYRIKMNVFCFSSLTLRQNLSLVSFSSLLKDLCGEDICLRISFLLKDKESLSSLSNLNFLQSLITPLGPKRDEVRWETVSTRSCLKKFLPFAGLSFCAAVYPSTPLPSRALSRRAGNQSCGTNVLH